MARPLSPSNDDWLRQIFSAKAAQTGGVVRRARADVIRKIGLHRFELEVRRRGFHLVEASDQFIIICRPGPIRVLV
ncbi:MAG: N-(5'-phosphoribosyl)anthranilate isomerase [Pseudomonadota bacterium]